MTVTRFLRSMTPEDIDIVRKKQSYSRNHSHRKLHQLLATLLPKSITAMNTFAIMQRLVAGLILPIDPSS
ncbi:hypothetical protein T01_4891 [Trichinella spiralis]|uniref:Uncharacterized protein n=1 Tax=Trichinella spiralis TaxID=6334 RepID=A0A0V1BN69_TRISP|nr:hypothetical protein T01_4891 [Trichinella spiralis]